MMVLPLLLLLVLPKLINSQDPETQKVGVIVVHSSCISGLNNLNLAGGKMELNLKSNLIEFYAELSIVTPGVRSHGTMLSLRMTHWSC